MINIGLTGNICSGYEQVAEIFKVFHAPVFDADIVLKFLLNYRQDIIRPIKIKFGSIYEKGVIDQNKFNTTEKFDKLIEIAEPELLNLYKIWKSKQSKSSYVIFKSSILFERSLNNKMNYMITVFRPKDDRAFQLAKTGYNLMEAYDIIDSEMDELTKNQKSEWTIHNYDSLSLLSQTRDIHDKIEAKSIKNIIRHSDYNYNTIHNMMT